MDMCEMGGSLSAMLLNNAKKNKLINYWHLKRKTNNYVTQLKSNPQPSM